MHRLLAVGFSLAFFTVSAQSITTPYSNFGIGEFNSVSLPNQIGMAGVGVSTPHTYFINLENPALLTYNVLTSFQIGLTADLRSYATATQEASDATASISHMVFAVPIISGKWSSAVSLLPYSSVNYDIASATVIENSSDSVTNFFSGSGGLSQVSWSHGVRLGDFFNVGLRASYVFGSTEQNIKNAIAPSDVVSTYRINYRQSTSYSDLVFTASMTYKSKIAEETFIHYGVMYDFAGSLKGEQTEFLRRLTITDNPIKEYTVSEGESVTFELPSKLSFGVSYEKISKTLIGFDLELLQWQDGEGQDFKNTINAAIGAQITPDFKDVNSYFKRMDYRFGVSYSQLPYIVNQSDVNEIGINFGVSFPTKNFSSVDGGFRFGSRGSTENNLLRENFAQLTLGLTINDRWFIKRRYD
jgi:hypothetical protein